MRRRGHAPRAQVADSRRDLVVIQSRGRHRIDLDPGQFATAAYFHPGADERGMQPRIADERPIRLEAQLPVFDIGPRLETAVVAVERPVVQIAADDGAGAATINSS